MGKKSAPFGPGIGWLVCGGDPLKHLLWELAGYLLDEAIECVLEETLGKDRRRMRVKRKR